MEDNRTQLALERFERTASPAALDEAFACARAAIRELGAGGAPSADVERARWVMARLPSVARVAEVAALRAAHTVAGQLGELWHALGLTTDPPAWNEAELALARELIVLMLAQAEVQPLARWGELLRRVAAPRLAEALVAGLGSCGEHVWQRLLGERYASVAQRYAPRTRRGHRGLAPLLGEAEVRTALIRGVGDWFARGAEAEGLPGVLEAAICHTRTPARVAV